MLDIMSVSTQVCRSLCFELFSSVVCGRNLNGKTVLTSTLPFRKNAFLILTG